MRLHRHRVAVGKGFFVRTVEGRDSTGMDTGTRTHHARIEFDDDDDDLIHYPPSIKQPNKQPRLGDGKHTVKGSDQYSTSH